MPLETANSYDVLPYERHPAPQKHPDHLATIAHLYDLHPPPVENCRVLTPEPPVYETGALPVELLGRIGGEKTGTGLEPVRASDAGGFAVHCLRRSATRPGVLRRR